jgi:hypothetical protein
MKSTSVIAFLDLLGTGYLADRDPGEYARHLKSFQEALRQSSDILEPDDKVHCFSDCAYVESSDATRMVAFLRRVRGTLLNEQIYLTAAITQGSLHAIDILEDMTTIKDKQIRERRKAILRGTVFGSNVARLYSLQDRLKGIGIRVDRELLATGGRAVVDEKDVVINCHFPFSGRNTIETFCDVKMDAVELRTGILDDALKNCLKANVQMKKAGRYYISFFICFVRSVAWEEIQLPLKEEDNSPGIVLLKKMIGGYFDRHFWALNGVELVFYSLFDEMKRRQCEARLVGMVERYVCRRRKLFHAISSLPEEILSRQHREWLLESRLKETSWEKVPDRVGPRKDSGTVRRHGGA